MAFGRPNGPVSLHREDGQQLLHIPAPTGASFPSTVCISAWRISFTFARYTFICHWIGPIELAAVFEVLEYTSCHSRLLIPAILL